MIRVGRKTETTVPSFENYINVVVLMKSSKYYSLSPYSLKDENGYIMENIWQFSKVYKTIPSTKQLYSRYSKQVIWEHPAEIHVTENGELTPEYWNWRNKGLNHNFAVRYPVGFKHRTTCLYSFYENEKLDYIEARKKIYLPVYSKLVKQQKQFKDLVKMLKANINILIIEVDGPHQESLEYYKEKYGVGDDFIVNNTMFATPENLEIMLNDSKHNFGHGYCLAKALLEELAVN